MLLGVLLGADDGSELGMLLGDVRGLLLGAMMTLSLVMYLAYCLEQMMVRSSVCCLVMHLVAVSTT